MKKCLAIFVRIVMILVILAGCKGSPTPTPEPQPVEPSPTPSEADNALVSLLKGGGALPPSVLADNLAAPLPAGKPIEVVFDQAMDTESTAAALRVTGPGGGLVSGQVSWPAPDRLVFTPAQPLEAGGAYRVRLDETAASAQGTALPRPVELTSSAPAARKVSSTGTQEIGRAHV